jgi:ClpX C4-type zinc finger
VTKNKLIALISVLTVAASTAPAPGQSNAMKAAINFCKELYADERLNPRRSWEARGIVWWRRGYLGRFSSVNRRHGLPVTFWGASGAWSTSRHRRRHCAAGGNRLCAIKVPRRSLSTEGEDEQGPRQRFEEHLYCSFCGKSQHEVRKLIAGHETAQNPDLAHAPWRSSARVLRRRLDDMAREARDQGQSRRRRASALRGPHHRGQCGSGRGPSEGDAGHTTSGEAVDQWLTFPPKEALALQKPLSDGALRTVATGEKEDGLAA